MPPEHGGLAQAPDPGAPSTGRTVATAAFLRGAAIDTRPLRYADFRRVWAGQGISFVGYQITTVATALQIFAITRSSLWVGLLGLAGLVPLVVFGLWGGAIADVLDRRRVVIAASVVAWFGTWGLLAQALAHAHSALLLLGLIVVQSAGFAVSGPTRGAIIPRLVPISLVPAANTLNFVVQSVGTVAGPLAGAAVVTQVGYGGAYGIDAALFTASLYASFRLPAIPPLSDAPSDPPTGAQHKNTNDPDAAASPRRAGLRSVIEGMSFISRRPILLMSFVADLIAMVVAMPRALFPQVAVQRFGGTAAVGWLYAAIAVGAVAGGVLSGWVGRVRRQGLALIGAIAGWGLFVAAAGASDRLWLTVALLAVGGACDLVASVYRQTILQTYAPDEMRGRLQGVFTVVVAGGPRLGDLRAGGLAAVVGTKASWVGGGIACAVGIVLLGVAVPSFARYRPRTAGVSVDAGPA